MHALRLHLEYRPVSRLHVSKINRELLQRLLQNDAAMVHYYAADLATLKRNRAEPSGQPDFRIHEQWSVTLMACQRITVRVRVSQPFRISLLSILKKQLKLSTAEIRWLVATGHIEGIPLKQLKTKKLRRWNMIFSWRRKRCMRDAGLRYHFAVDNLPGR